MKHHTHWRDLARKRTSHPLKIEVILVGNRWNPETKVLEIAGLTDFSETEEGKNFLRSDFAKAGDPVLRVFRVDEPVDGDEGFFLLQQYEGDLVLGLVRRHDLIRAA